MLVIRDLKLNDAISHPELRFVLQQRFTMLSEDGPDVCAYFILLEVGDSLAALNQQLGFSILHNRFDGKHCDDPDFIPSWEILEEHASFYEMVFVLSDDGYGVEVFIPKAEGIDPALLALCRRYAVPPACGSTGHTAP